LKNKIDFIDATVSDDIDDESSVPDAACYDCFVCCECSNSQETLDSEQNDENNTDTNIIKNLENLHGDQIYSGEFEQNFIAQVNIVPDNVVSGNLPPSDDQNKSEKDPTIVLELKEEVAMLRQIDALRFDKFVADRKDKITAIETLNTEVIEHEKTKNQLINLKEELATVKLQRNDDLKSIEKVKDELEINKSEAKKFEDLCKNLKKQLKDKDKTIKILQEQSHFDAEKFQKSEHKIADLEYELDQQDSKEFETKKIEKLNAKIIKFEKQVQDLNNSLADERLKNDRLEQSKIKTVVVENTEMIEQNKEFNVKIKELQSAESKNATQIGQYKNRPKLEARIEEKSCSY